jgi:hypothetical protein
LAEQILPTWLKVENPDDIETVSEPLCRDHTILAQDRIGDSRDVLVLPRDRCHTPALHHRGRDLSLFAFGEIQVNWKILAQELAQCSNCLLRSEAFRASASLLVLLAHRTGGEQELRLIDAELLKLSGQRREKSY